ncbi:unnamed protein product, partial [Ectocarpus sp. 12 AP-2014]
MQATEILLRRLRDGGDASKTKTSGRSSGGGGITSTENGDDDDPGAPQDCFSPIELTTLVEVHGYSPEDARRALTICHEMRKLEAAGVGGVAAAQELTRRVLCGTGVVVGGGGEVAGKGDKIGVRPL